MSYPPVSVARTLLSELTSTRGRRGLIVALSFLLPLLAQDPSVFRTNVNLVHVIATVKNKAGELVGALTKEDFTITDNGVPQEVAVFERQTDQPLSVALLIDVSGSTAKDLKFETDSAARFLHALLAEGNPEDRVALYSFDDSVRMVHNFTHNFTALDASLKKVSGLCRDLPLRCHLSDVPRAGTESRAAR